MTVSPSENSLVTTIASASVPLLALNNAHATELSPLTLAGLNRLIQISFCATAVAADASALLIAFDQSADYSSPNFSWFRERYDKFVYVDRVVTSPLCRGKGYAKALYTDLFQRAKDAAHSRIVCEVNLVPPNPISYAFHAGMGFTEIGRAAIHDGQKTVRYLVRSL